MHNIGHKTGWLAQSTAPCWGTDGLTDGRTDGRTDRHTARAHEYVGCLEKKTRKSGGGKHSTRIVIEAASCQ